LRSSFSSRSFLNRRLISSNLSGASIVVENRLQVLLTKLFFYS
jgi:hypothetical protein